MLFVTSNKGKISQAKLVFEREGLDLEFKDYTFIEPDNFSIKEIASSKAKQAFDYFKQPLFVEDSIMEINTLNGFPGVISNRILKEKGIDFFLVS